LSIFKDCGGDLQHGTELAPGTEILICYFNMSVNIYTGTSAGCFILQLLVNVILQVV